MLMRKVEKNIPIPNNHPGRKKRYPFDSMEIGDSFETSVIKFNSARSAAWSYGKKSGKVFTSRRFKTIGRIWRIK